MSVCSEAKGNAVECGKLLKAMGYEDRNSRQAESDSRRAEKLVEQRRQRDIEEKEDRST